MFLPLPTSPASRWRLPGRQWPPLLRRLRAGYAIASPELLIVFVFRLRPGLPARASGLPLRWGSAWGSGSAGLRRRRTDDYPRPTLNISASSHAPATSRGSVRGLFKCDGLRAGCACATAASVPLLLTVYPYNGCFPFKYIFVKAGCVIR